MEKDGEFVVGGIGRDGPEDRGLSERCIVGFNQGHRLRLAFITITSRLFKIKIMS